MKKLKRRSKILRILRRGKEAILLIVLIVGMAVLVKNLWAGIQPKLDDWQVLGEGGVETLKIKNVAGFYHGRNVCLRGNEDGIHFKNSSIFGYYKPTSLTNPMNFKSMEECAGTRIKYLKGTSYISNCWRRWSDDTNPAHWAMKLGILFFLANDTNPKYFMSKIDRLVFHQCANPFHSNWEWGIALWNITLAAFITRHNPIVFWTEGNIPRGDHYSGDTYYCFEDAFWDVRYGTWILEESREAWSIAVSQFFPLIQQNKEKDPCIAIFERRDGFALRQFENIGELRKLVGLYTNHPVQIISVDKNTSIREQVSIFNSFDILITSHGSHLANILFSIRKVTIIEVVSCTSDMVFWNNAKILGIKYVISSGHLLGNDCNQKFGKIYSSIMNGYDHQGLLNCESRIPTKQCNIQVNLTKIQNILHDLRLNPSH